MCSVPHVVHSYLKRCGVRALVGEYNGRLAPLVQLRAEDHPLRRLEGLERLGHGMAGGVFGRGVLSHCIVLHCETQ